MWKEEKNKYASTLRICGRLDFLNHSSFDGIVLKALFCKIVSINGREFQIDFFNSHMLGNQSHCGNDLCCHQFQRQNLRIHPEQRLRALLHGTLEPVDR